MTGRFLVSAVCAVVVMAVAPAMGAAAPVASAPDVFRNSVASDGLLPVHVDRNAGRILLTLPPAGADGTSGRFLFAVALRTGLGSAQAVLDRGKLGDTQVLAFRRLGGKVAIQFENPRFRAVGGAASADFATSTVWMGDIAATLPDGSIVIDISSFLTTDMVGIAVSLSREGDPYGNGGARETPGRSFRLDPRLSAADPASIRVFPDNIEVDAVQTYAADKPGPEVANVAPDARQVSFGVHYSLVRLPAPGFVPRVFDPRIGGIGTQAVDFGVPLGGDVVREYANRFRLEKLDPAAARSRVKKPIIYYLDRNAPEPVRSALIEGIGWWGKAFDAAGYIDAFQVKLLPEGADPLDVRYNMVNWVDRATRGWSYGQQIDDPRTGEIIKGMVVLGSLRARQDIQIFEGLVGADKIGSGGANDPVQVALARLRQLGAHEVGHTLGFDHNFAASTQDRASVMDYPAPRIGLVDGKPDLSDAYGVGLGIWDMATVDWLYGEPAPGVDAQGAADAKAATVVAAGMRYVTDAAGRAGDTASPWGGLWDDGADPVAELGRMMQVRRAAIDNFGLAMLAPGEPVANLRRRFVPIWLLHRYQVAVAAKAIGGVDATFAVNGGGHEAGLPVAPVVQRAALAAVLATLSQDALRVPAGLVPLLSAAHAGSDNRQFDTELFATAGGPVFDALAAADVGAEVALGALLAPRRLARLQLQHAADAKALGVDEMIDRLLAATVGARADVLGRRIAYRSIVMLAQAARNPATPPDVALALDARLHDLAGVLAKAGGDAAERAWAGSLSRKLLDAAELERLAGALPRAAAVPPGDPIGGGEDDWMPLG